MIVQVKNQLTKGRNPSEHGLKLENQQGEVIHMVGDGYVLIRFEQFKIRQQKKINSQKIALTIALEWYVHDTDFYLIK
jgi:hypothetical protein